ncbi:MAG: HEAT repeat domain-containing protein [Planctomycetes bacterium]|nr:HEAT repeat domain-containing protein [Planctomycetota bacterium]
MRRFLHTAVLLFAALSTVAAASQDETPVTPHAERTPEDSATAAPNHVRELIEKTNSDDRQVRVLAAYALADLGSPDVPALVGVFENGSKTTRREVVKVFRRLGGDARAATAPLRRALEDPHPDMRGDAVRALAAIGPDANEAIPAILDALHTDPSESVRCSAVYALPMIEPDAARVIPHLVDALDDMHSSVRRRAIWELTPLDLDAQTFVPRLIRALEDESGAVQSAAVGALGTFGAEAEPAVSALVSLLENEGKQMADGLEDGDSTIARHQFQLRCLVVETLGEIGPGAESVLPVLFNVMRSGERPDISAAEAIRRIDPRNEEPLPFLLEILERNEWGSSRPSRSFYAAQALKNLGPAAAPAVPALTLLLQHEQEDARENGADILGTIGPAAKVALPELIGAMRDDNKPRRPRPWAHSESRMAETAAEAVHTIDPDNLEAKARVVKIDAEDRRDVRSAVPDLIKMMQHGDPFVRQAAAEALAAVGDRVALPALIWAVSDERPEVRIAAANALGQFGSAAEEAVPALREALRSRQNRSAPDVRREVATALGEIGTAAANARLELRNLRYDEDPTVRKAAADAYGKVSGRSWYYRSRSDRTTPQ